MADLAPSKDMYKQNQKSDWNPILLNIEHKYFIKETDKSYCFKLWGKKFLVFPKQFVKEYGFIKDTMMHTFHMPLWFILKHGIDWFVDDNFKDAVPSLDKKSRKKKDVLTPDMYENIGETQTSKDMARSAARTFDLEQKSKDNSETAIEIINELDSDIPW